MGKEVNYTLNIKWTGNKGTGTTDYRSYERAHEISAPGKPAIPGSSDPAFRGDRTRYNPEEMLVGSLSSCHMLWYLHLCSEAGVIVVDYTDEAKGLMIEDDIKGGWFKEVHLYPKVVVKAANMIAKANELHHKANSLCFIANSVNFPVMHSPSCTSID